MTHISAACASDTLFQNVNTTVLWQSCAHWHTYTALPPVLHADLCIHAPVRTLAYLHVTQPCKVALTCTCYAVKHSGTGRIMTIFHLLNGIRTVATAWPQC
jgi:hypothetical protein